MASSNDIEIKLSVVGGQQAQKTIEKVEDKAIDLKDGVKGVGEGFKSVGDLVKAQGGLMGDAFGTLGESVIGLTDSIGGFKDGMSAAGATGAKAWLQLLGPIAAVISAISLAVEAYRTFSGAAQAAEDAAENMAAAASDTASRLEAMVEKGINLSTEALREFIEINTAARLSIEEAIKINEKRTKSEQNLRAAREKLIEVEDAWFFRTNRTIIAQLELNSASEEYNRLLDEQVKKQKEASDKQAQSYELEQLRSESIYFFAQALEDQVNALADMNAEFDTTTAKAQIAEAQMYLDKMLESKKMSQQIYDANTEALRRNIEKIDEEAQAEKTASTFRIQYLETIKKAVDIQKVFDKQLKEGVINQKAYDEATKNNKKSLKDQADALQESIKAKGIDLKLDLERAKMMLLGPALGKYLSKGTGTAAADAAAAAANASAALQRRQRIFDREIELLQRQKTEIDMLTDEIGTKSSESNAAYVKSAQDWLLSTQRIKEFLKNSSSQSIRDANVLAESLAVVSTAVSEALSKNKELLNKALSGEGGDLSGFISNLQQALSEVEGKSKDTLQKVLDNITKKELEILAKRKEFQTKNRRSLGLTQKQIDEDYIFAVSNLAETSGKQLVETLKSAAESQMSFEEAVINQKSALNRSIKDLTTYVEGEKAQLLLKNVFLADSIDLDLDLRKKEHASRRKQILDSFSIEEESLRNQKSAIERKLALMQFEIEQSASIKGTESFALKQQFEREKTLADIQLALIEETASKTLAAKKKAEADASLEFEKLTQEQIVLEKKRSFDLRALFLEEDELRRQVVGERIQSTVESISKETEDLVKSLDLGIAKSTEAVKVLQGYLEGVEASFESLSDSQKARVQADAAILKSEQDMLVSFLDQKQNLIAESTRKISELQEQARKVEAEKAFAEMQSIATQLKDIYIAQVQTISSGLGQIFYDESTDQKLKELESNRQAAMDQYKGDMKARSDIEKQYLQQKRQIQAEDANMVSNLLKQTLRAAAQEALVKSIYHTGLGFGALAMGPLGGMSAAGHFKAAAIFAGLATLSGIASKAAGSGAAGAGASTSLSPTGASQTTSAPVREEAKNTEPIVFNINLAGATVYDTRQAAEQAMANRIMSLANRSVRGASNPFTR